MGLYSKYCLASIWSRYGLSEAYCASIIWPTKQQGHKKSELHHALNHIEHEPELVKNPLIFSIANEVWHELSIFNQLYFLVKMTVEDMLRLNTLIQWHKFTKKWGGYIIINKEATAGFLTEEKESQAFWVSI